MFNSNFYPTPKNIIAKMISGIKNIDEKIILEPSAGKGDIIDYLIENSYDFKHSNKRVYCIEKEPELQHILRGKGYKVIDSDFLTYSGDYNFNLILMNPPFDSGCEHLLKAIEIMRNGDIICLLNAETINNPYSKNRKLLKQYLTDYNAIIENLGNCFSVLAERKTNVEVVMVKIHIEKAKNENDKFNFDAFKGNTDSIDFDFNEQTLSDKIAMNDVIGNMIIQYQNTKNAYIDFLKALHNLKFYSNGLLNQYSNIKDIALKAVDSSYTTPEIAYNDFVDNFKSCCWQNALSKLNVEKLLTANVREKFREQMKHQGYMDFTKENIFDIIQLLLNNQDMIMKQAIIDVFDLFTKYHKDNRIDIDGWKTNDYFKVNKKIILPYVIECGFNGYYRRSYGRNSDIFNDIEKVMCFLTGKNFESINTINDTIETIKIGSTDKYESEFFYIRAYKKGTIHLYFKSEDLWNKFNIEACLGKFNLKM